MGNGCGRDVREHSTQPAEKEQPSCSVRSKYVRLPSIVGLRSMNHQTTLRHERIVSTGGSGIDIFAAVSSGDM